MRRGSLPPIVLRVLLLSACVVCAFVSVLMRAAPAAAQQDTSRVEVDTSRAGSGWDLPRVRELMARAAIRRAQPRADTSLHNYRATAQGFLYFFLDRRDTDERTLVRVNQIGLELYWKQPGIARQKIAGMRDASPLPNTMRYHIDHFTMVQNGFGDTIRVGDGDEVKDVIHPASPNGAAVYSYRLADSLELRIPSMPTPIRVYEVQVRPRRTDRPGFVGSVFVDRETFDIIRMTFTFTPSSYVDKRLDYINLSLDNGLWESKYWLPHEQTVEIRRQIPELDFVAGSVIRGHMRVTDYEMNTQMPDSLFRQGRAVVSAPPEALKTYPFDQGIFDDVANVGLSATPETARLREEAAQLIGAHLLSGLPHLRFYYPDVSSGIRYNRAESLFLGLGLTYSNGPPWRVDGSAGYAFGSQRPSTLARITFAPAADAGAPIATTASLTGYTHAMGDIGPITPLAGVANTLSSAVFAKDYLDPWFASGATVGISRPVGRGIHASITGTVEQQRSALLAESHALFDHGADFRAIRAIDDGTEYNAVAALTRITPSKGIIAWGGTLSFRAARFNPIDDAAESITYVKPELRAEFDLRTASHARELRVTFAGSTTSHDAPIQQAFAIGGTGTLPGYAYRSFVARASIFAGGELTQRVIYPWLGIRGIAAVGATSGTPSSAASASWPVSGSHGARASAGAGVSLFWDILHIDEIKGLNGGHWVTQISFTRLLNDIS